MDAELRDRKRELETVKENLMAQLNQVVGRITEVNELESNGYYLVKRKEAKKSKSKNE